MKIREEITGDQMEVHEDTTHIYIHTSNHFMATTHTYTHTHSHIYVFFSIIGYYKILNIVPCAIQ